jgi:hypothetical protein
MKQEQREQGFFKLECSELRQQNSQQRREDMKFCYTKIVGLKESLFCYLLSSFFEITTTKGLEGSRMLLQCSNVM